jgi:hypothetical protein
MIDEGTGWYSTILGGGPAPKRESKTYERDIFDDLGEEGEGQVLRDPLQVEVDDTQLKT